MPAASQKRLSIATVFWSSIVRAVGRVSTRYHWDLNHRAFQWNDVKTRRGMVWRWCGEQQVTSMTFQRDGITWTTTVPSLIGRALFIEGHFHGPVISAVLTWMKHAGILSGRRRLFIDVGANIGTTCIPVVLATDCVALAIEPTSENYRLLERNVHDNGLDDRVFLAKKAVLSEPGKVRMRLSKDNPGSNYVDRLDAESGLNYEEVEADTLTGILATSGFDPGQVALVWADIQGCEGELIASGKDLWNRGVALWAEIEPHSLEGQGTLNTIEGIAAEHFDRFIKEQDLLELGPEAPSVHISGLGELIRELPWGGGCNVLLLPPARAVNSSA
jgi:FkbM family methyltransferase